MKFYYNIILSWHTVLLAITKIQIKSTGRLFNLDFRIMLKVLISLTIINYKMGKI